MKDKKLPLVILAAVMVVMAVAIYGRLTQYKNDNNYKFTANMALEKDDKVSAQTEDDLIISEKEAVSLVLDQIDPKEYSVAPIDGLKEIDEAKYYLFDIVNKSGPSFAMKIAINARIGQMLAYDPDKKALVSMEFFPLKTPMGQAQDWNGVYKKEESSDAMPLVSVNLRRGDLQDFEFDIVKEENGEALIILSGIAQISGSNALYKDGEGNELLFIKKDGLLKLREPGSGALGGDKLTLQGTYVQQD